MEQVNERLEWRDGVGLVAVRTFEEQKKAELYDLEQAHREANQALSEARIRKQQKVAEFEEIKQRYEGEIAELDTDEKAKERAFNESKSGLELGQRLVQEHAGVADSEADAGDNLPTEGQGEAQTIHIPVTTDVTNF